MAGLFHGKKGLITGVSNSGSHGWTIANRIMHEGGDCGLTFAPDESDSRSKNKRRLERLTHGNDRCVFLQEMNAVKDEDIATVAARCASEFGRIDFVLHSLAFAPVDDFTQPTIRTSREGFLLAMEHSVYSLIAIANATRDIMNDGGSILTVTNLGGERISAGSNVMGVCWAALNSATRYLAGDLGKRGIRVNALSPGPVRVLDTPTPEGLQFRNRFQASAPLGRMITSEEVGNCGVFLLSTMANGITAEVVHLDAGFNATA